jgi:hypothetical protein
MCSCFWVGLLSPQAPIESSALLYKVARLKERAGADAQCEVEFNLFCCEQCSQARAWNRIRGGACRVSRVASHGAGSTSQEYPLLTAMPFSSERALLPLSDCRVCDCFFSG